MKLLLFIALGIVYGLLFSYRALLKIIRIRRTSTYRINKLPMKGQVIVVGKAEGKNTKNLLKRTDCSLWQIVVEGYGTGYNTRRPQWTTIYSQMSQEPFELSDETGRIQIYPANAQLILYDDINKSGSFFHPLPARIRRAVEELGVPTIDAPGIDKKLRVHERIIDPGDEIYIFGEVIYENDTKVIKSEGKLPFIISDHKEFDVTNTLFTQIVGNIITGIIVLLLIFVFAFRGFCTAC